MDPSPSPGKDGEERGWAQPRLSDVKNILSILIGCDSWVQNMLCPLSWNSSYLNVWDFKEAEQKILLNKCWSSGNDRTKAGDIFTYFSGCQSILHKGHHLYWRHGPQHMPRDQNATDYEKFCLVTTTLGRKWFYISNSSVLRYTTSTSNSTQNLSCQSLKTTPETTTDINKHVDLFFF